MAAEAEAAPEVLAENEGDLGPEEAEEEMSTSVFALLKGFSREQKGSDGTRGVAAFTHLVTHIPIELGRWSSSSSRAMDVDGDELPFLALSKDSRLSRKHAQLDWNNEKQCYELVALSSAVVDGTALSGKADGSVRVPLRSGSMVRLGLTRFYFLLPNAYSTEQAAAAAELTDAVLDETVGSGGGARRSSSARGRSMVPTLPKLWQTAAYVAVHHPGEAFTLREIATMVEEDFKVLGAVHQESLRLYVGKDKRAGWRKMEPAEVPEDKKKGARPNTSWFIAEINEDTKKTAEEADQLATDYLAAKARADAAAAAAGGSEAAKPEA